MNYIGSVIKEIRKQKGLSRPRLADGVCTVKYLYMIEKGERTPSAEVLRLLSLRLGADLFGYFEFLDCEDPVTVHDAVAKFNAYRIIPDFTAAKEYGDQVEALPDFQRSPWKYEILVNNAAYMLYVERRYQDCIDYILPILENLEPRYREEDFVANFLVALSSCYLEFKDFKRGGEATSRAAEILKNKENFPRYNTTAITVKLNKMSFCHVTGDFDGAIEEGLEINRIQFRTNSCARANFTYYYLAYAYYKKDLLDEALGWFEKCLFDLLMHRSDVAAYFISNYGHFYDMLENPQINPALADKFLSLYNLEKQV